MVAPSGRIEAATSVGGTVAEAGTAVEEPVGAVGAGAAGAVGAGAAASPLPPLSWMLSNFTFARSATWFSSTSSEEVSSLAGTAWPSTTSWR